MIYKSATLEAHMETASNEIRISKTLSIVTHLKEIYIRHSDGNEVLLNCSTLAQKVGYVEAFDEGSFTLLNIPNHSFSLVASFINSFPGRVQFDSLLEFWSGLNQRHISL